MPNVIGLFNETRDAQGCLEDLLKNGFDRDDISLVRKGTESDSIGREDRDDSSGVVKGAGIGAALGGIGGLLVGIGALAIPGFGPLIAAGPLMAALGGAGIGAATGGIIGALTDMGVPEEDAKFYEEGVRRGGTLVTVSARDDSSAERAVEIMEDHEVVDIDHDSVRSDPEYRPQAVTRTDIGRDDTIPTAEQERRSVSPEEKTTIPVIEEQFKVGKRTVQGRRIRIYGRVKERPVEETVRLRDEHVTVEHRAANRPVTAGDKFDEAVIEITETREEPVTRKEERVVEEVVIGKDVEERSETVRGTVHRKDVEIDRYDEADGRDVRKSKKRDE
jgi:stress response protein YsnF